MINERMTLEPKWHVACRRCSVVAAVSSYMQPGESVFLKVPLNVDRWKRGKPDESRSDKGGILTVRKGEGLAGKGCQKKQMPTCNGLDRMESSCDKIIRRESVPTSGRFRRWRWPLVFLTAGDVRRWRNPLNEAAGTLRRVGYSEGWIHRWIGFTLRVIAKSIHPRYAVT